MQFRLKSLFIVVLLVAMGCGVLVAPARLAELRRPECSGFGVASRDHHGDRVRPPRGPRFAIGCLASGGWVLWAAPYYVAQVTLEGYDEILNIEPEAATTVKIIFVVFYGVLFLAGLVGVGVRRLLYQGCNGIRPPRDCC